MRTSLCSTQFRKAVRPPHFSVRKKKGSTGMDPLHVPDGVILFLGSAITTVFIGPWLSALNYILWWIWVLYPLSEPGNPVPPSPPAPPSPPVTCDAQLTFDYIIHFTLMIILGTVAGHVFKLAGGIPQLIPYSIESGHSLSFKHRTNHLGLPVLSLSIMILFQSIFISTGLFYENSDVTGAWYESQKAWSIIAAVISALVIIVVFAATYLEKTMFAIKYVNDPAERHEDELVEMKYMIFFFIASVSLMMATYTIPAFLAGIWPFWLVWVLQAVAIALVFVAMYLIPVNVIPTGFTSILGSTASGISWDVIITLMAVGTIIPALLVAFIMEFGVTDIWQYEGTIYGLFAIWMIISVIAYFLRVKGSHHKERRNEFNFSEKHAETKIRLRHHMFH